MIISKSEYEDVVNDYMGWCPGCGKFTRDMTEPDAEGYDCPECGEEDVMGAELALASGEIEIGNPKPRSVLSKYIRNEVTSRTSRTNRATSRTDKAASRTSRTKKRNMSPTVRIPVTKMSEDELISKALNKVDEAISKLETAERYLSMAGSERRKLVIVKEIVRNLKSEFYD